MTAKSETYVEGLDKSLHSKTDPRWYDGVALKGDFFIELSKIFPKIRVLHEYL